MSKKWITVILYTLFVLIAFNLVWLAIETNSRAPVHPLIMSTDEYRDEIIFGLWVIPLLVAMGYFYNWSTAVHYLDDRDFTEALFVVVIMVLAATKPILYVAESILKGIAQLGGGNTKAWWLTILTVAPLLGSFITEPGAMTIATLLLIKRFYRFSPSITFAYATIGLLFTNISVGGVLTSFAAPPILVVSKIWGWNTSYMFTHFGLKAIVGILLTNAFYFWIFRSQFKKIEEKRILEEKAHPIIQNQAIPLWVILTHMLVLDWCVLHAHYPVIFIGTFMLFLGFYQVTAPYQDKLELKNPILVGLFLAGLVVHGSLQGWWISPLLTRFSAEGLLVLSIVLTSFNDNAAITFLASLIPNFDEALKQAVVTGAITGGGLTVIANAPNPAGQSILGKYFNGGISPIKLFFGALLPTLIMVAVFYLI